MGTAMGERLLEAAYPLLIHNRTPEKGRPLVARGATLAESRGDLAARSDVVLTSLADDDALEEVAADVVAAARPRTVLVDVSTVSPGVSARVAALAQGADVDYLRAPVSGNPSV